MFDNNMIWCIFDNDKPPWTCSRCGWTHSRHNGKPIMGKRPRHLCPNSPDITEAANKLGITGDDIKHWAQALARWTAAGFPTRTQAEMETCLRVCVGCDNFVPSNPKCASEACKMKTGGRCKLCGCGVSKSRWTVFNMAKMATATCRMGKWPETEHVSR